MGFVHETINSVSIELKKENDILKEQLAVAQANTKTTTVSKRKSKKKNS